MNKRSHLLQLADKLVNGDRNRQYGDPNSDFSKTAALWETYLNGVRDRQRTQLKELGIEDAMGDAILVEPQDVAVMMILLKVSRLTWSPDKEDHWADIAGYAACGYDCVAEEELDEDEEFQNDISVNADDHEAAYQYLMELIYGPKAERSGPMFGGFLGASILGKEEPKA